MTRPELWSKRKQAEHAQRLLDEFLDFQKHLTNEIAAADAVEGLRILRHMNKVLRSEVRSFEK